ncbi:hypothetical protein Leryth_014734, partial [Lithospermum erythrorhizon]
LLPPRPRHNTFLSVTFYQTEYELSLAFWLCLLPLKNNEIVGEEVSERDEEALKYLKDIKWTRTDEPKGFKLDFSLIPILTSRILHSLKLYHMIDVYLVDLEKAIGTEIEWYPEKCLTQKILKKKPKKGSKSAKPITKTEQCESFFNFFSPPEVPDDEEEIDEDAKRVTKRQWSTG